MYCQLHGFLEIQFDPHLLQGSQTISIIFAETPTQRGTIKLDGSLLQVVVTGSGIVYLLSLAIFCVCGFLCGRCALKHKESTQYTVASYKAERQVHPPPRYPAPVYENTQPAKAKTEDESDSELHHVNVDATSCKSEQQACSTTLKLPAIAYENVLPVCGEAKKNVIEIQLQDLEMKKNVAYGPV